jgi:ribosomal protein S3
MAKSLLFKRGKISLQSVSEKVQIGTSVAYTKYGLQYVKVWLS